MLDKKIRLSVVGFHREQTDFIGFSSAYKYINVDGTNKSKGVETELTIALNPKMKWISNYTFTEVDKALDRLIPKHKVNSSFDYQITSRTTFNVNYQYIDDRNDAFFDGNTYKTQKIVLGSYQLINASLNYELVKNKLNIFGAATNILNEEFVENVGYNTLGRNFKLGLSFKL